MLLHLNKRRKESSGFGYQQPAASMDADKVLCPICAKEFASSVIEAHASKCLFLNESTTSEGIMLLKDSSPMSKRSKLKPASVKKTNQAPVKRKSSLDHFPSQSFRDPEDVKNVMPHKSVIFYYYYAQL